MLTGVKLRTISELDPRKIVQHLFQYDFQFRNCFWLQMILSKSFLHRSRASYLYRIPIWRVTWPFFSSQSFANSSRVGIVGRHFCAVCAEHHARISLYLPLQQSIAVVNESLKPETSKQQYFNYC